MKKSAKRIIIGMAASIAVGATVIGSAAPTYALSAKDQAKLKSTFRSSTKTWKLWRNDATKKCAWRKDCKAYTDGYSGGMKYVRARIMKGNKKQADSKRVRSCGDVPAYTFKTFEYNNPDTTKWRANKDFGTAIANYGWEDE